MDGAAPEELVVVTHFEHPRYPDWLESVIHVYSRAKDSNQLPVKWPGETVMSGARLLPITVDPDAGRQALLVTKGSTLHLLELHDGGLRDALSNPHVSPPFLKTVGGVILMDDDQDGVDEIIVTEYDRFGGYLYRPPDPPVHVFDRTPKTGYWSRRPIQGDIQAWLPRVWEAYLRAGHYERAVWVVPTLMNTADSYGIRLSIPEDLQRPLVDSFHKETKDEARAGLLMASSLLNDPYTLLDTITPSDRWILQFVQWERLLALSNDKATRDRVFKGWTAWRTYEAQTNYGWNPTETQLDRDHVWALNPWRPILAAFNEAHDPRLKARLSGMELLHTDF